MNQKVNSGHYHEIMDRTGIILANIDDYILNHPGMTKEMNKLANIAIIALSNLYQLAGKEMVDFMEREEK